MPLDASQPVQTPLDLLDEDAEKAILGAILMRNRHYEEVAGFLREDHFAVGAHAKLYRSIKTLIGRGETADPITLKRLYEGTAGLEEIGGFAYMVGLTSGWSQFAGALDPKNYARTVVDFARRRRMVEIADKIRGGAYSDHEEATAEAIAREAEQAMSELAQPIGRKRAASMAQLAESHLADIRSAQAGQGARYLRSTIQTFDHAARPRPGDLTIIMARPSMGKTSLALCVALGAARKGAKGAFFSLEQTATMLLARAVATLTAIPAQQQIDGPLCDGEVRQLEQALGDIAALPLRFLDGRGMSVSDIRHDARSLHRRQGLDFMVVDHLGLVRPSRHINNPTVETGETAEELRAIAGDLGIPVLLLCQLNRGVEGREDRRPQLSDIRQSGQIEEHADTVIALYREEYYLRRKEPMTQGPERDDWDRKMADAHGVADMLVLKRRDGDIGNWRLHFEGPSTRFTDAAR